MSRSVLAALSLALAVPCSHLAAQGQVRAPAGPGVTGEIRGKLVDSISGRPVITGSITVRRATDTAFAGGGLPGPDGSFRVDGLAPGRYNVRIRSLGFVQVLRSDVAITPEKLVVDLGPVPMRGAVTQLEKQQVIAEREEMVVQPDRNVYSTKNMTAATGGTAIDILRNVPQVEVDAQNRVSLRGNGNVVIQINGRSTPLKGEQLGVFLSQMPAKTVKTIEVAANPSAKDDPEGTAGIINIVLDQEAELGLSGGLSLSTATTGQLGGFGNIGKQQGKLTMFVSGNVFTDHRMQTGTISRENVVVATPKFVETDIHGSSRPLFSGGNVRAEYRFTPLYSLTLDSYFNGGRFANSSEMAYTNLTSARDLMGAFRQMNDQRSVNFYHDYDLAFRRQGKPTEPQLTLEAEFSNNWNTNDVDLSGAVTQPDATTPPTIRAERDHTTGSYPYFNSKIDYSHPFGTNSKFDVGAKYQDRSTTNDFTASLQNTSSGAFDLDPTRSSSFVYREHIGGAYGLLSRRFGKFQTQIGTRLELAQTMFDLPIVGQRFDKHYASVYPSGVVTYNLTDLRSVRMSYSRRVSRPNPWQLSPIEFKQDSRNVFRGNPGLGAEYTDAMDFSFLDSHSWGSIQLNPYARRTNNAVRNIQYIDANGISVGTFANLAHNSTVGADLNVNYRRGPFTGGGGGSLSRYSSDANNLTGSVSTINLSTQAISWNARFNGTWKWNNKWDSQVFTNYRAPTKTEGGSSLAFVNLSLGTRYKIWGEQGNISVRVSDPFNMSKFGYRTANGQVIEFSERYFGARAVFISISRNFGQALRLRPKSDSEGDAPPAGPPSP